MRQQQGWRRFRGDRMTVRRGSLFASLLVVAMAVAMAVGGPFGCSDDSGGDGNNQSAVCAGYDCGHGQCRDDQGQPMCDCETGYLGLHCGQCADGYHDQDGSCVEDTDPHRGTPTIDGAITEGDGDWTADQNVGHGDTESDWGANAITDLYVAYDDENLYVAVKGTVETNNAIVLYIDTDYGPSSQGLASIASASDNDGALDNALSADLTVTDASFKTDFGMGTKGMASATTDLSDDAGWRHMAENPADFSWIAGTVVSGTDGFEASIQLSDLLGAAPSGQQIALFARIVNEDGQYVSNQTLPPDAPSNSKAVSKVATVTLGGSPSSCNHNGTCDAGETETNCPDDCPSVCNDDGTCDSDAGETFANCPGDCPATCDNDGTCEPDQGESHANCAADCPDQGICGDPSAFQWDDGVMYFVMVDRFFDSDGQNDPVAGVNDWAAQYEGGDWKGVTQKVAYLQDLGVNVVWLSAPYENRNAAGAAIDPGSDPHMYSAYHGYWPSPDDIDYSDPSHPNPTPKVESRFGTASDLHELVDTLHGAGIKVMFDYVMNHVDVDSGLYQAHHDWFVTLDGQFVLCAPNNWDDSHWSTRCAFTSYLPPFNFYKSTVRHWSVADATWWASEYGIDGYRLDAIKHVPMDWLTELRSSLTAAFPNPTGGRFYLVGETYAYDDQGLIASFIDPTTKLDGQFDFPLRKRVCDTVFAGNMDFNALFGWMDGNDSFYSSSAVMTTWIGNHDIPRAIHFASGQITDCYQGSNPGNGWNPGGFTQPSDAAPYERLGLVFGILLTTRGIPLIYYGDEIGMAGGGDPDNRRMMQFDGWNQHQQDLHDLVRTLVHIRADNVALRRGHRQTLSGGTDTFAYKMAGCGPTEDIYVLLNRSDSSAQVSGLPSGNFHELVTDSQVSGGPVEVPARSIRIFKLTP